MGFTGSGHEIHSHALPPDGTWEGTIPGNRQTHVRGPRCGHRAQPAWEAQGLRVWRHLQVTSLWDLITKPAEDRGCCLCPRRNDRDHAAIQGLLTALGPELGTLTATLRSDLQQELWMPVNPDSPAGSETHFRAEEEGELALA